MALMGEKVITWREKIIAGRKMYGAHNGPIHPENQLKKSAKKIDLLRRPNLTRGGSRRLGQCPNFSPFFVMAPLSNSFKKGLSNYGKCGTP